jgi:hypothetical protein
MRLFVLVLAILLLPLRGWMGDAMALEAGPQAHVAMSAAHDMTSMDDMTAAAATPAMADMHHDSTSAQPDCQNTCTACQLCHSVAMTVWPDAPVFSEAPRQVPVFWPSAFASAEPAPGFKPPIS